MDLIIMIGLTLVVVCVVGVTIYNAIREIDEVFNNIKGKDNNSD